MDKVKFFLEVCDWYGYDCEIRENGTVVASQSDIRLEYENINEALKDWLATLEESNKDCDDSEEKHLWDDEEINFIKALKAAE